MPILRSKCFISVLFLHCIGCADEGVQSVNSGRKNQPSEGLWSSSSAPELRAPFTDSILIAPLTLRHHWPNYQSLFIRELRSNPTATRWPSYGDSFSDVVHALHAFSNARNYRPADRPSFNELISVATRQDTFESWYPGEGLLIRTSHGYRYPMRHSSRRNTQAHIDQTLAVLAELGIPSSKILALPSKETSIREVIEDCKMNFQCRGEFEWSSLALMLYAPKLHKWQNRFYETYSHETVVNSLLAKKLGEGSCFGTHVLYALAASLQIDTEIPLLSDECRTRVEDYLDGLISQLESSQLPDGSLRPIAAFEVQSSPWYTQVHKPAADLELDRVSLKGEFERFLNCSVEDRLLYTSHSLEWLSLLPIGSIDGESYIRAVKFVDDLLTRVESNGIGYCPYSHSVFVLLQVDKQPIE